MNKTRRKSFLAGLLCLALMGCGSPAAAETAAPETTIPETAAETEAAEAAEVISTIPLLSIESIVEDMTLREKVGQLFVIRPDALDLSLTQAQITDTGAVGATALTAAMAEALAEYPVGGIVMFSKNIESPDQITAFNRALQEASAIPLFLCVDEEGGDVARLASHKAFDLPRYKNAAAIAGSAEALEMGRTIGAYLKEYGFNVDFAPVADVNTNPYNPIIGKRAFSSDAATAAVLASSMAEGLRQQGIIAAFKHFPGHGDTFEDSHGGVAVTDKTAMEMALCEWLPFMEAEACDLVMAGHIAAPEITGSMIPATMSHELITGILKEQLGFEGLVITDSLEMAAVTDVCDPGDAALSALNAGCDLLLMPNGLPEAFNAVVTAVENGTYSEDALDQTVARILRFKLDHGLLGAG